jgi:hypothetical protein
MPTVWPPAAEDDPPAAGLLEGPTVDEVGVELGELEELEELQAARAAVAQRTAVA